MKFEWESTTSAPPTHKFTSYKGVYASLSYALWGKHHGQEFCESGRVVLNDPNAKTMTLHDLASGVVPPDPLIAVDIVIPGEPIPMELATKLAEASMRVLLGAEL